MLVVQQVSLCYAVMCPAGRAAHFRARLSSGMRDAHDCQHKVPEGFSSSTMQSLLHYLYMDDMSAGLEPSAVVQLLHAAAYYGTPRYGSAVMVAGGNANQSVLVPELNAQQLHNPVHSSSRDAVVFLKPLCDCTAPALVYRINVPKDESLLVLPLCR